jgi:hypothetical protein
MLNVTQAARAARCSSSNIYAMIKAGHLKAAATGTGRNKWQIDATRDEVKAAVLKHHPRSGFRKNAAPKASGAKDLRSLLTLATIPAAKRQLLLKIGQRFNTEELKLILSL